MAIYKTADEVDPADVWLHMRSFATADPIPISGQGLEASYSRDNIRDLTDALSRIICECVDAGDIDVTGCDLELYQTIIANQEDDQCDEDYDDDTPDGTDILWSSASDG